MVDAIGTPNALKVVVLRAWNPSMLNIHFKALIFAECGVVLALGLAKEIEGSFDHWIDYLQAFVAALL